MANIKIEEALFHLKGVLHSLSDKRIGQKGISLIGLSSHRTGTERDDSAKLSSAASIIDALFSHKGDLQCYSSTVDTSLYVKFNDMLEILVGVNPATGNVAYTPVSPVGIEKCPPKYVLLGWVLYQLFLSENSELIETFNEIMEDGPEDTDDLKFFTLCDSVYYGNVKKLGYTYVDILDPKTEAEIEGAFRSGSFQTVDGTTLAAAKPYLGNSPWFEKAPETTRTVRPSKPRKSRKAAEKAVAETMKAEEPKHDFMAECREGRYRIKYDWPEEMQSYIPGIEVLDGFVSFPEFESTVKSIFLRAGRILARMAEGKTGKAAIANDKMNYLLVGKPGTGKTRMVEAIAATLGMPLATTVINHDTDQSEFEGKTKIIKSTPAFVETDCLKIHREGGCNIFEEINLALASVTMGGIGQATDGQMIIKMDGYKSIVRHPLEVVFATMNVGTEGSNNLNSALITRFRPVIMTDPDRETSLAILQNMTGEDRTVCSWVQNAYERVTSYLKECDETELLQNLCLRTCSYCIQAMEEGMEPVKALEDNLAGALCPTDMEMYEKVKSDVIANLPAPTFSSISQI